MSIRRFKSRLRSGILALLGFGSLSACDHPDMYGPVFPSVMYGPLPPAEYLSDDDAPSVQPSAVDMQVEDSGEETGENE